MPGDNEQQKLQALLEIGRDMDHYPCHHGALWEREILPLVFPVCNGALMSSRTQRSSRGVACIGLRSIHKAKGAWATKTGRLSTPKLLPPGRREGLLRDGGRGFSRCSALDDWDTDGRRGRAGTIGVVPGVRNPSWTWSRRQPEVDGQLAAGAGPALQSLSVSLAHPSNG